MSKANRYRNAAYLRYVRRHTSCLGWASPGEPYPPLGDDFSDIGEPTVAHHVRLNGGGGVGFKPSDYRTVPLTDSEHRELHQAGERSWWAARGVDPREVMIALLTAWCSAKSGTLYKLADDRGLLDFNLEMLVAEAEGLA